MSTITTRTLSKGDPDDCVAVKVESADYDQKWGYLKVIVNSYTVGGSGSGTGSGTATLDVRPPKYNEGSDSPCVATAAVSGTTGIVTVSKKYLFAVNNGQPPPNAIVNADGSWDLLHMTLELDNDGPLQATLDYTTSFTDLTPSTPGTGSTKDLIVDDLKTQDQLELALAATTYAASMGYVTLDLNALTYEVTDLPVSLRYSKALKESVMVDGTPIFRVASPNQFFDMNHFCSKYSGKHVYSKKRFLFAVNSGKVDANGLNVISAASDRGLFAYAILIKVPEVPCDDKVKVTLDYSLGFTSVT